MLHSLVTAASDASGGDTSKTAFYICGALLVIWAFVVTAIGISRHDDFPSSDGAMRGVMGISAVLVVLAMATAVATA